MTSAIKADNARYQDFAARLLATLATEERDIARTNVTLHRAASADVDGATVAPAKVRP